MSARVVTSWMAEGGIAVLERAVEITEAMRRKELVVSLPPGDGLEGLRGVACGRGVWFLKGVGWEWGRRTFQDGGVAGFDCQ